MVKSKKVDELIKKYQARISKGLGTKSEDSKLESTQYLEFKRQFMPRSLSLYEQACNLSEKILPIKPSKKDLIELEESIKAAHLNITPKGAMSFVIIGPLLFFFAAVILGYSLTSLLLPVASILFPLGFAAIFGLALVYIIYKLPRYFADAWRLEASNEMIIAVFYVVTYMRHTSNLEGAIKFASDYLGKSLSLDFKRILWDVETGRFASVKESLDSYLEAWRKWNVEFIEAMHLIEGSLYEGAEARRLALLDKSLEVILEGSYEKMLHFAHSLKSPITMLHMLGVILPILGLVILPLVVSFMTSETMAPTTLAMYISALYNIALPLGVFYLGKTILAKRPTGYGDTDIAETNPEYKKYRNILIKLGKFELAINPVYLSIFVGLLLLFIGISPILMHWIGVSDVGFGGRDPTSPCGSLFCLLEYKATSATKGPLVGLMFGPYGMGAGILSIAVVMALGLGVGLYYALRSKNVIKIRAKSKQLEKEFASALFQLGNRLGDGLPTEIAFGKVAQSMKGTLSGDFMRIVSDNITKLGMGVEKAIFDPKLGALQKYPSSMIRSSMKVLTQAARKGPKVAAQTLINISGYIKEIHRVNERLRDLMAEIVSSMNAQIKFMAPVIAGVVIGITSMVTTILGKLTTLLAKVSGGGGGAGMGGMQSLVGLLGDGMPTYYFQIIVGIYIVQIIYILSVLVNGIENGSDALAERYVVGQNLLRGTMLYSILAFTVILVFNFVAGTVLQGIVTG